jgi:outer membrane protein assembly factor BamB
MHQRRHYSRWVLAVNLLLLAVLGGFFAYHRFYAHAERRQSDPTLIEELAGAVFLDEEPADTPEWPQWRGPHRDGVVHARQLLTQWPKKGPAVLWQAAAGEGYSAVSVAGGRAYTLVGQGNGEVVVCWNSTDGKELWRFGYEGTKPGETPGPRASPTLDGDRVYTLGGAGHLHCLDAATGKLRWKHDLRKEYNAQGRPWGHSFSPLVEGQLLITAPGGTGTALMAFDKNTGEVVWQSGDDPPGYSSPVLFTAGGVRQIVSFTGNSVVGARLDDGKVLWRHPWETQHSVNAATPLTFQARQGDRLLDYVFISSGYNRGCTLLKIAKSKSGDFSATPVFENNLLCSHFASPVRRGEFVFGFNEAALTCLDLRSGEVRWKKSGFQKGSLLRVDDFLLVLGENGKLALMKASAEEPEVVATAKPLSGRCWTMPVLAGGRLFLRNEEKVLCLDLQEKDSPGGP